MEEFLLEQIFGLYHVVEHRVLDAGHRVIRTLPSLFMGLYKQVGDRYSTNDNTTHIADSA